jgi:hypothetical protein
MKASTVKVAVQMEPSGLLSTVATELLRELNRLAPYSGYHDVADLEEGDILKYLSTLVWMRCKHVDIAEDKAYKKYKNLYYHLEVPVLPYQMLIAMGRAYDRDFNIEFCPEYSIDSSDLLSPDELLSLSNILRSLTQSGFQSVTGLPKERDGELDFMAMCHVKEEIVSYRDSHPVYGFLAAFFKQQELNEITGALCRVVYGYESDYNIYVSQIMTTLRSPRPADIISEEVNSNEESSEG